MREFLVETLKHLKKSGEKSFPATLSKVKDAVPTSSTSSARLLAKEKELQEREESVQAKEKSVTEKEQRVQREMKALKEKEMSFSLSCSNGMSGAVLEKERELLDFKDRQLSDREQALQREKQSQQDREHSFHMREKLLLEREVALQAEKKLHQEREQFIQSKERQQQDREDNLQAQKKLQQEREESLEALERQLQAAPTATPAAPRRSKANPSVPKTPPNPANPATPPNPAAQKAAPKRQARGKTSHPPEVKDRSSRSRERVEVTEDPHPKTKRRKTSVYLTYEELRWEWMQSQPLPCVTEEKKQPVVAPSSPEKMSSKVNDEKKQPLAPSSPEKISPKVDMPWDTDLMVELDEVEPPLASSAKSEVVVHDEAYDVDGLDEEDLFGPEEASYMPPKSPMMKPQPVSSQPSKPPEEPVPVPVPPEKSEASGAKKKKDWYQRHYPGQVAPREPRAAAGAGAMPANVSSVVGRVSSAPSKAGPSNVHGTKQASKADAWAYEPLKLQEEVESQGLLLPDPLISELPSIDDILPML